MFIQELNHEAESGRGASRESSPEPEVVEVVPASSPRIDAPMLPGGQRCSRLAFDGIIRSCKLLPLKRLIQRSVINTTSNEASLRLATELISSIAGSGTGSNTNFALIAPHIHGECFGPHVHVWHDCDLAPPQYSCRHPFMQNRKYWPEGSVLLTRKRGAPKGYRPVDATACKEEESGAFAGFIRYAVVRGGEEAGLFIGGTRETGLHAAVTSALPLLPQTTPGPAISDRCGSSEFVDVERRPRSLDLTSPSGTETSDRSVESCVPTKQPSKKLKYEPVRVADTQIEAINKLLHLYIYAPPSILCHQLCFSTNEETKNISPSTPEYKQAIANFQTKLRNFSFNDYKAFYRVHRNYIFRPEIEYFDVQTSFLNAMSWIEFQAANGFLLDITSSINRGQQRISAYELAKTISDVVNRCIPKLRCLQLSGPSSVGKTWFTNMILDFYLNRGDLANWNKNTNAAFPFMDLVNRRIIVWNEALANGDATQRLALVYN
jgi:hypothetical protein